MHMKQNAVMPVKYSLPITSKVEEEVSYWLPWESTLDDHVQTEPHIDQAKDWC